MTPDELLDRWHSMADSLREFGADAQAGTLEKCADELAACLAERNGEELTLSEAHEVSGYSEKHLRRLIAQGRLRDIAQTGATRVRMGDLPRKPGHTVYRPLRTA